MIPRRTAGFGLVEAVVALVILAFGVLAAAAVSNAAAALLRAARLEEVAVDHAAALLDSLFLAAGDGAGEATLGPVRFTWSARTGFATEAVVLVQLPTGSRGERSLLFSGIAPVP